VISITTPGNARSRRVMEKLGLSLRGDARWHDLDVVWYALDRPAAPPSPPYP
jgi:RimJ/RimL family protein N-acetyltransferase